MAELSDAALARLEAVLAQHARAQGVNPRDHGVVAVADLRALLAAQAQAAPVLAAAARLATCLYSERSDATMELLDAITAWRAAREG